LTGSSCPRALARPGGRALVLALVLAASALTAPTARAQEAKPWTDTALEWTSDAVSAVVGIAGSALSRAATYVLPEAPFDWLPEQMSERERDFVAAMQALGYRLAGAETGGGLLPSVQYRFVLEREPTPADVERARASLEQHRARYWGINATGQRSVLRSLIDASGSTAMRVAAVEIGLRPFPWIRYELSAVDRPLEDAERRLIERMKDQSNRSGAR